MSVLLASGSPGGFASKVDYPISDTPAAVVAGDMNGDGRPDLIVTSFHGMPVDIYLNQIAPATLSVSTPAGVAMGSPFVVTATLKDSCGNVATGFSGPVTLVIKPGTGAAGAALGGTTTVNAVNGVASFGGLTINKHGTGYVLRATAAGPLTSESTAFIVFN